MTRKSSFYAVAGQDVVAALKERAASGTPELVPVIERAITLVTRVILRSDDSSGMQGDMVRGLLDAHATAVRSATPSLSQQEQTRLVRWLMKYRYGGSQDFFDPDIVAYAPGLSAKSRSFDSNRSTSSSPTRPRSGNNSTHTVSIQGKLRPDAAEAVVVGCGRDWAPLR